MVKKESHSSDHLTGGSHRRVGKDVHSFLCMFIGMGETISEKLLIGQIRFPIRDSCRAENAFEWLHQVTSLLVSFPNICLMSIIGSVYMYKMYIIRLFMVT